MRKHKKENKENKQASFPFETKAVTRLKKQVDVYKTALEEEVVRQYRLLAKKIGRTPREKDVSAAITRGEIINIFKLIAPRGKYKLFNCQFNEIPRRAGLRPNRRTKIKL